MQIIRYYSDRRDPAVDWVFAFLSSSLGCTFQPCDDPLSASLLYTEIPSATQQLHIPVWHEYYESTAEHILRVDGYWIPLAYQEHTPVIDYIGLIFRLLTLADELRLPSTARDPMGNLFTETGFPRAQFRQRAMVDEATQNLKHILIEHGLLREDELLPRWPAGKRYAVLITHDTDGPCLLEPFELAKAGIKGYLRANEPEKQAFREGCRRLISGGTDPYFNFAHWAAFEESIGARSAFYLYVKGKGIPQHLHNPPYRLDTSKPKWKVIHHLAKQGWEIGLHTSIHGLKTDEYIQSEKQRLEDFLGGTVTGNRSHYWRIDWRDPIGSFQRLQRAGFSYDASMAWKDAPGFRSGTALPYHPYDPHQQQALTLLQLPTSLMDGHLFQYQAANDANEMFDAIVQQAQQYGSMLVLDWHTRTWADAFAYEGWRSFLTQKLGELASTGEIWFTTPGQLSRYWSEREHTLLYT